MEIVATYIVTERDHPYALRKVYETANGSYYMELPGGLWILTEGEFESLTQI
jgi:hypothetical protein